MSCKRGRERRETNLGTNFFPGHTKVEGINCKLYGGHCFRSKIPPSKLVICIPWILFTVSNVDRDIGRHSGRYGRRHSVDSGSTLGRDTVDSRSRCVSADIAFRSPTLRRLFADSWSILDRCIGQ